MDTIVFIETNKSGSSREAIKAANNLNFFTVLLTCRKKFLKDRSEFPDVHEMIFTDINDYDNLITIIEKFKKTGKNIKGIFSFIDPFVYVAARLSEEFCQSDISTDAIYHMEDKILTRNVLKELPISLNYLIYNKKVLIIINTFKEFRSYLINNKYKIIIYINYKNIIYFIII